MIRNLCTLFSTHDVISIINYALVGKRAMVGNVLSLVSRLLLTLLFNVLSQADMSLLNGTILN